MSIAERLSRRLQAARTDVPVIETDPRDTSGEPRCRVVELGSFSHGECLDCQWQGPGRRARSTARKDADLHSLTGCGSLGQVLEFRVRHVVPDED